MSVLLQAVPHIKARFSGGGYILEHCEDVGCCVEPDGRTDCKRLACPSCGYGGANLSGNEIVSCSCGHFWIPSRGD